MADRIVVVRVAALGDVLVTFPTVAALAAKGAQVDVVGPTEVWNLATPLVRHVTSGDEPFLAGLQGSTPDSRLQAWLADATRVIVWSTRKPSGHKRITWASPFPPPGVSAVNWYARTAGVEPSPVRLTPDPEVARAVQELLAERGLTRPILIHPGAGARWKRWPAESFARVVETLRWQGHEVALIAGPADEEALRLVQEALGTPAPAFRNLPLGSLAALLSRAALFLGNDSGVTHLAALAGTPLLALFGPTDPATWAPVGGRVLRACTGRATRAGQIRVCMEEGCMAGVRVEDVLEAIAETVDNPC